MWPLISFWSTLETNQASLHSKSDGNCCRNSSYWSSAPPCNASCINSKADSWCETESGSVTFSTLSIEIRSTNFLQILVLSFYLPLSLEFVTPHWFLWSPLWTIHRPWSPGLRIYRIWFLSQDSSSTRKPSASQRITPDLHAPAPCQGGCKARVCGISSEFARQLHLTGCLKDHNSRFLARNPKCPACCCLAFLWSIINL